MNAYKSFHTAVKALAKPTFTGAEVMIEWRPTKGRGDWRDFQATADYIAYPILPLLNKDRYYEFRVRTVSNFEEMRKSI